MATLCEIMAKPTLTRGVTSQLFIYIPWPSSLTDGFPRLAYRSCKVLLRSSDCSFLGPCHSIIIKLFNQDVISRIPKTCLPSQPFHRMFAFNHPLMDNIRELLRMSIFWIPSIFGNGCVDLIICKILTILASDIIALLLRSGYWLSEKLD